MAKIIGGTTATPIKITAINQESQAIDSLKHYGDANIVPSDASLFEFTLNSDKTTANVKAKDKEKLLGDIVIPYECVINDNTYPVTTIYSYGFNGCNNMSSVLIPKSVTRLASSAFTSCKKLAVVEITGDAMEFGTYVFNNSVELERVTLPSNITQIGTSVFGECNKLKDIYFSGTKEQWLAIEVASYNEALYKANIHFRWSSNTESKILNGGSVNVLSADLSNGLIANYETVSVQVNAKLDLPNFGNMAALYFTTPAEIPENYSYFSYLIKFKGDSVEDEKFVPEASTRYTVVFENNGSVIVGYVSGVTL